jgi:hypothetical protein
MSLTSCCFQTPSPHTKHASRDDVQAQTDQTLFAREAFIIEVILQLISGEGR